MDLEEKLQHERNLSKARSKSYYERNREKILEKRKIAREAFNQEIKKIKEKQIIIQPVSETIETIDEPVVKVY